MGQVLKQPPEELPFPFGRYRLLRLLGRGGRGTVYLAHDDHLDRSVALKMPLLGDNPDSPVLARFQREARAAAALHHPNICPLYDVGEIDGLPYLTMAYIEGKPLSEFALLRPLLPRQSAVLVRKLALALQEAHKRNVIHRDLKPSNIMIDKRGEPVIMDFGVARRARPGDARITREGATVGTPAYMPPEQISADHDAVGPASDVYSLGMILYELLTGRLPFTGGDMMAVISQVLLDDPPSPSRIRKDLDLQLEAICLKAIAKKIDDRYASMSELAAALFDYLRNNVTTPEAPAILASMAIPVPAAENETPAEGMRVSEMGGLRSVAQFEAARLTPQELDSPPPRKRRRRKRTRGSAKGDFWIATGWAIFVLGIVALIVAVIYRAIPPK